MFHKQRHIRQIWRSGHCTCRQYLTQLLLSAKRDIFCCFSVRFLRFPAFVTNNLGHSTKTLVRFSVVSSGATINNTKHQHNDVSSVKHHSLPSICILRHSSRSDVKYKQTIGRMHPQNTKNNQFCCCGLVQPDSVRQRTKHFIKCLRFLHFRRWEWLITMH